MKSCKTKKILPLGEHNCDWYKNTYIKLSKACFKLIPSVISYKIWYLFITVLLLFWNLLSSFSSHSLCIHKYHLITRKVHASFIVRNCSFSMGSIFCSSIAIVWNFNTRSIYSFNTKKVNIPVNFIPFFDGVSFLFLSLFKVWSNESAKKSFSIKEQKGQW